VTAETLDFDSPSILRTRSRARKPLGAHLHALGLEECKELLLVIMRADSARELRLGSLGDAAEMCQVHKQTIRRYISAGRLTGYRFGPRLLRVNLDEVAAVLLKPIPAAAAGKQTSTSPAGEGLAGANPTPMLTGFPEADGDR
jgi:excisionase family DNA binding protein